MTATEKRYGHEVAPQPTKDTPEAAYAWARYHAARAQGFWLALTTYRRDDLGYDAVAEFLSAYQLTYAWTTLAGRIGDVGLETVSGCTSGDGDEVGAELAEDLNHPHVLGPMLWQIATGLGLDPDQIKAYGPETNKGELDARAVQLAAAEKRATDRAVAHLVQRGRIASRSWVTTQGAQIATALVGAAHDLGCGCEDSTADHLQEWAQPIPAEEGQ